MILTMRRFILPFFLFAALVAATPEVSEELPIIVVVPLDDPSEDLVEFIAESGFWGWQDNCVNVTSDKLEGLQKGAFNYAEHARGIQFGLVNYAGRITGLQIGLMNIIRRGGILPVCIIFNGSF